MSQHVATEVPRVTSETTRVTSSLLDRTQAAAYLGMSKEKLRELLNGLRPGPQLQHVRIGTLARFRREWLDEYLEAAAEFERKENSPERQAERQRQMNDEMYAAMRNVLRSTRRLRDGYELARRPDGYPGRIRKIRPQHEPTKKGRLSE